MSALYSGRASRAVNVRNGARDLSRFRRKVLDCRNSLPAPEMSSRAEATSMMKLMVMKISPADQPKAMASRSEGFVRWKLKNTRFQAHNV